MLHKALCSGGILPLVKLYTSQEVGHGLHRNPEGVDEFVLFSELSCFFIKRLSVRNLFSMPQWIGGIVRSTSR